MSHASALIDAIDAHLATDDKQLRRIVRQTQEVLSAFEELLARLRREVEAGSTSTPGAYHLRG